MTHNAGLLPYPLAQVLEYEKAVDQSLVELISQNGKQPQEQRNVLRCEVFGLPGMGKSTLAKCIFHSLQDDQILTLFIPEAADYAVLVKGLSLSDFEPFLNEVYKQAEEIAVQVTKKVDNAVILREPSHIQNEIYRLVQRAYYNDKEIREQLDEIAREYSKNGLAETATWDVWSRITKRYTDFDLTISGPWSLCIAVLSTRELSRDLDLSLKRQASPDRDPRLVTSTIALLIGYWIGITNVINAIRDEADTVFYLDPQESTLVLSNMLFRKIAALRTQR